MQSLATRAAALTVGIGLALAVADMPVARAETGAGSSRSSSSSSASTGGESRTDRGTEKFKNSGAADSRRPGRGTSSDGEASTEDKTDTGAADSRRASRGPSSDRTTDTVLEEQASVEDREDLTEPEPIVDEFTYTATGTDTASGAADVPAPEANPDTALVLIDRSRSTQTPSHPGGPIGFGLAVAETVVQVATSLVGVVVNPVFKAMDQRTVPVTTPAEWALVAWTRREFGAAVGLDPSYPTLGTTGPALVQQFIDQTVASLLNPVRKLIFDLTGELGLPGQGMVTDGFPGACRDGVCDPSSDIPIPQPNVESTFLNLAGERLVLSKLETEYAPAEGPSEGFVLDVGRSVEFMFYNSNPTYYAANMEWVGVESGTVYSFRLRAHDVDYYDGPQMHFTTPEPVTGATYPTDARRQTFLLLPSEPGATITIDPTDPIGQATVATSLCDVVATCRMEAVDQKVVFTDYRNVGSTLFNRGTLNSTNTYDVSHKTTSTSGFQETAKAVLSAGFEFSFLGVDLKGQVGTILYETFGTTWTDTATYTESIGLPVAPGKYGQIQVSTPMYESTVDMTIEVDGVTIEIPGTVWLSPVAEDTVNENGQPVAAPSWRTVDYDIGTGPMPYPDSDTEPSAPDTSGATPTPTVPTPDDIAAPEPGNSVRPSPVRAVLDFMAAEVRALLNIPASLLKLPAAALGLYPPTAGVTGSTRGFEIVNLTANPVVITGLNGGVVKDESPPDGYVLQPFQMVRVEVEYGFFGSEDAGITWQPVGSSAAARATLVVDGGTGDTRVDCGDTTTCMNGGYDDDLAASILYIVSEPGTVVDVTDTPNLASAVVNAGCEPDADGRGPMGCSVDITTQEYYFDPATYPASGGTFYNNATTTVTHGYSVTLANSVKYSWSSGGGIKISEKAGLFIFQQVDLEVYAVYQGSLTQEQSERTGVTQSIPSGHTGQIAIGDAWLRTYGDWTVRVPNTTFIVRGQYVDSPALLDVAGPIIEVTDYPGPPQV